MRGGGRGALRAEARGASESGTSTSDKGVAVSQLRAGGRPQVAAGVRSREPQMLAQDRSEKSPSGSRAPIPQAPLASRDTQACSPRAVLAAAAAGDPHPVTRTLSLQEKEGAFQGASHPCAPYFCPGCSLACTVLPPPKLLFILQSPFPVSAPTGISISSGLCSLSTACLRATLSIFCLSLFYGTLPLTVGKSLKNRIHICFIFFPHKILHMSWNITRA